MSSRARRLLVLLPLSFALVATAAGCGGGDEEAAPATEAATSAAATGGAQGDAAAGKSIFAQVGCGSCHVLEDAGTSGSVGPNLDDAQPSFDLVVDRVTNGASPMPAYGDEGALDEQQIKDVAAYVVQATQG